MTDGASTLQAIIPTGMMQTSDTLLTVCQMAGTVLSKLPTVEQGFPADPAGDHWTWSQKLNMVSACIEGLYQAGWGKYIDLCATKMIGGVLKPPASSLATYGRLHRPDKSEQRETQPYGLTPFDEYNFAQDTSSNAPDDSIQHFVDHYPYR